MGRSGGGGSSGGGGFGGSGGFGGGFGGSGRGGNGGFGGSGRGGGGSGGRSGNPGGYHSRPGSYHGGGFGWGPSFGGLFRGPTIFVNNSRRNYGGGGGGGNNNSSNNGCGTAIALIVIILVFFAVIFMFMLPGSGGGSVGKSTVEREKLPPSAVNETAYYTDEDGDWIHNSRKLESGMKAFYKETGVQPYVYILPNGSASSVVDFYNYAKALYDELFTDGGHFLLLFCDDGNGYYDYGFYSGSQAQTVMDEEAVEIFLDYLERYYSDYSIDEEEIFSNAFEDTGRRIMTVTKSPVVPIAICIAVIVVAVLLFAAFKKHHKAKERERQEMEEILQTPLEKFGDDDVEDLAKKYRDKND